MTKEQILLEFYKYKDNKFTNYVSFIFLNLLFTFKESFYKSAENILTAIYADMVTLSNSPNCSCRGKVIKYINHNSDQVFDFVHNWINTNNENTINKFFEFLFKEIDSQHIKNKYFANLDLKTKRIVGNVLIIEDEPTEYRKVIEYIQKESFEYKDFKLFNLIENDKKYLKFYFY
jgi:hypothetical protein